MPGRFGRGSVENKGINSVSESNRDYCSRRGGVEEVYDITDDTLYYRPFVYGAPPRLQIWGRRMSFGMGLRLRRIFKQEKYFK